VMVSSGVAIRARFGVRFWPSERGYCAVSEGVKKRAAYGVGWRMTLHP